MSLAADPQSMSQQGDFVARLWPEFVVTRDPGLREQIIAGYMGFARMLAASAFARRGYVELEFDDYLQYARLGLIESVDRFKPGGEAKFESYAAQRIKGAILNGIASSSDMQEQIVARKRLLGERAASLRAEGPHANGVDDVFARLAELAIGLAVGFVLEGSGMLGREDGEGTDASYQRLELKQLRSQVRAALEGLAANHRQVLRAHYFQQQPFQEIAHELGLSRGRVAQIHRDALGKLDTVLRQRACIDLSC